MFSFVQIKAIKFQIIQSDKMGPSQTKSDIRVDNPNDYFLSMIAQPEKDNLQAEVNVATTGVYHQWLDDLKKTKEMESHSILLPKNSSQGEKSLCGQNFKLKIDYPCYHILLSKEIDKRQDVDKYLEEAEMWYLLYCLAETAHACHVLGKPVGDIRPQNILLNKAGNLKILSKLSIPAPSGLLAENPLKGKHLLAPEELASIKKSHQTSHLDYITAESFSIGMTMLSAGTLQEVSKCYNYLISELSMLEFNKTMNFWHQNQFYSEKEHTTIEYSKSLKTIVMNLLELTPEKRMTSLEVYDLLSEFKDDIMSLKSFNIKVERWSPRKKGNSAVKSGEGIHMLRSRKGSQKSSPQRSGQKVELVGFNRNKEAAISEFQSPSLVPSVGNSFNNSLSPTRKKKINTSLTISQKKSANK